VRVNLAVAGVVCGLAGAVLVWGVVARWGSFQHFDGRGPHPDTRLWWAVHYVGWALIIVAAALQVAAVLL